MSLQRIIKFRVWDKENKLFVSLEEAEIDLMGDEQTDTTYRLFVEEPFVLQQYTGIRDISGIEIYEGDIININNEENVVAIFPYTAITQAVFQGKSHCYVGHIFSENKNKLLNIH